ncbi:sesquipedalian-1 [Perognathus longimembris pacificus]|uniref:sesquipedalian-1 n=1 Tax=Perognathus longimembris pacificus TaxID=214514 RepID=UPI0020186F30|nr:sesquipedalian-1 [Perognathus longimembris pacificus]XP_048198908.1 sesquipedalian-1 [Perognathus longimembris pacificus]XP_048198909.1 sesquipedalian-1 [Perognathus longimembris pacificus]
MKLNERSLARYATCDAPVDKAGFLHKRGGRHAAFQRRWFVLRGNMLFYFEAAAEAAAVAPEPLGVIVLEGCTVELAEAAHFAFAFAVRFAGARARSYVLAADSQGALEGWVKALSRASFAYLRLVVRELEQQLAAARAGSAPPPALQDPPPALQAPPAAPPFKALQAAPLPVPPPQQAPPRAPPRRPFDRPAPVGKAEGRAAWSTEAPVVPDRRDRPPLPPRRRASATPEPPASAPFARLHEWYGQEVLALRTQWRSRAQP